MAPTLPFGARDLTKVGAPMSPRNEEATRGKGGNSQSTHTVVRQIKHTASMAVKAMVYRLAMPTDAADLETLAELADTTHHDHGPRIDAAIVEYLAGDSTHHRQMRRWAGPVDPDSLDLATIVAVLSSELRDAALDALASQMANATQGTKARLHALQADLLADNGPRWSPPAHPGDPAVLFALSKRSVSEVDDIADDEQEEIERPWPTLDPITLEGLAGDIVAAIRPHTEADDPALLVSVLTMVGAVIGPEPALTVEAAKHPARLFSLIVGETAKGRKSTAIKQVRPFIELADPTFFADRVAGGFGSGEGLADVVQGPTAEDGKPINADRRLLVIEQEFARVLKSCARDGSILSAILRELWDGDRVQVRSRSKSVVIDDAHVSALAAITVDELRILLTASDTANGFANRFLFVGAKRARLLPDGGTVPVAEIHRLGRRIADVIDLARTRTDYGRTNAGRQRWAEMYTEMAENAPSGIVGSLTARAEPQVLRLALAYALLDGAPAIDTQHYDQAYALWKYCSASVFHIFGHASGDPLTDRVLSLVRASGDMGLTRWALSQALSGNVGKAELDRACSTLVAKGLLVEHRVSDGPGRPTLTLRATKKTKKTKKLPLSSITSSTSFTSSDGETESNPITSFTSYDEEPPCTDCTRNRNTCREHSPTDADAN